jgi:DNA polymerase V
MFTIRSHHVVRETGASSMQFSVIVASPVRLPLMARPVPAGFPSPADDHAEGEIDLGKLLIENRPATFIVRVQGDSMTEARMFDGDLAIVDRSLMPLNGDIVVVDIDGERSFKIWRERQGRVALSFANARYPEFILCEDAEVEIWGVVVNTIGLGRRCEVRLTKSR